MGKKNHTRNFLFLINGDMMRQNRRALITPQMEKKTTCLSHQAIFCINTKKISLKRITLDRLAEIASAELILLQRSF